MYEEYRLQQLRFRQPLSYLATGMRADGGTDVKLFHDRSRYTGILFPLIVKL